MGRFSFNCRGACAIFATALACTAHAQPSGEPGDDLLPADQAGTPAGRFSLDAAPLAEPLVTDRPDFTESTETIPWGHAQLEAGYTFTHDRERGTRTRKHTAPELLLRVGVVENFELRFGWEGYGWTDTRTRHKNDARRTVIVDDWHQGASDFELGFKLKVAEQDNALPHLALLGSLNLPTGSANTSAGDVEPLLGLLWAYDLNDRLTLAGQVLVAVPTNAASRFVQTSASVSLGASLTDRLGAYAEYFFVHPNSKESDTAHTVNGGLTFLIHCDFQVDWRVGFGLNEEADDFFTGVGFAWRL